TPAIRSTVTSPAGQSMAVSALRSNEAIGKPETAAKSTSGDITKQPAAIPSITGSNLPAFQASYTNPINAAEMSPIHTSAHDSVRHESFENNRGDTADRDGNRIPGTTTDEGDLEAVSASLELMKSRVMSREFWMADDICKECFL